jgi:carboxypeptidase Taq
MTAYKELEKIFGTISDLGHVSAICGWDETVNMSNGGGPSRANAMAALSLVMHNMIVDPKLGDLFKKAKKLKGLTNWQKSNLREMHDQWQDATLIPGSIVEELTKVNSTTEHAWRELRIKNDWKNFRPHLEKTVAIVIKEATILSDHYGCSLYDSLLMGYEPSFNSKELDQLFGKLKKFLPKFIDKVIAKQNEHTILLPTGPFAVNKQKELGLKLIDVAGFDFNRGRLDLSHHPFCGGVSDDVRITTRYVEDDFTQSLMGILHEAGHGKYEQGLPRKWRGQPVGQARSMAVHESQSLLQEMQICLSKEFITFASKHIKEVFGMDGPEYAPENLYRYYTQVEKSLIRVDADEVTYPLHIILRYEIEKDLINGEIKVKDIPALWDEKMKEYFNLNTKGNYKDGCMQDVHWPCGSFGYFPSYTLGALMAAQLYSTVKTEHPAIPSEIEKGKWKTLNKWLEQNIWSQGCLHDTDKLINNATGESLNIDYFKNYLTNKYLKA